MQRYALQYPAKADVAESIVQDFHSFRQALNVASADQRVLVLINAPPTDEAKLRESLKPIANHANIIGRFHFDFDSSGAAKTAINPFSNEPGIAIIAPGEFGLTGKVIQKLPLDASRQTILQALESANTQYAQSTAKKVYSTHVSKGRKAGVYFEGAVPYGEDRDGDGQIDQGKGRRRR
ncbi:hypothetical protein K239x_26250 [Planctomycetes bacterium K23_9]|uniref:Uncharacterized protein n=2 Tax=Stieleria marina TaxID=1930275 RepID=A0A517NU62_9BACT|nr:hypothetical protein K239x_26250 [Planctomycetes bacterium K23_9]